ncbi:MAG: hypothetical protein J6W52_02860 [Bacteroidaceae bacterium]|nr:hypothetical protein [Bacteroidaceae bacterium]
MRNKRNIFFVFFLLTALSANAQCRYCNTYEDFMAGRWEPLDTVYSKKHSKGRQFWVGGNDFTLTTGDKATDNMLKYHAFAVKQGRRLYVNCRNLEFQKTRFGKGYAQAMTMGKDTVFFVNKKIGKDVMERQIAFGSMFGAIGTAAAVGSQVSQQVCYIISSSADKRGYYDICMIDDGLMGRLIAGHDELYDEYFSESDRSRRLLASHIYPILKKAGLFKKLKQKTDGAEDQE